MVLIQGSEKQLKFYLLLSAFLLFYCWLKMLTRAITESVSPLLPWKIPPGGPLLIVLEK